MRSAKVVYSAIAVMLVLAFSFTTVGAQSPVDQWDQEPLEIPEISLDAVIPTPIAPVESNIYVFTKTPKFYFTQVAGAVSYQIEVKDALNQSQIIYTYTGPGTCTNGYCWLQPDTPLKPVVTSLDNGLYLWRVCAKFSAWGAWSSNASFIVLSTGFNSSFNTDTKKWQQVTGVWTRTDRGYYKTPGILGKFSSVAQKELFRDNLVFEVRLKRKVEWGATNSIIILGSPGNLYSNNEWKNGYYLNYGNNGYWSIWLYNGSSTTPLLTGAFSPYIIPYGWNTFTVWRQDPYIRVWINGAYAGSVIDQQRTEGWVGVGMWENLPDVSPLLMDSAKLYYSAFSPYAIPGEAMDEPLNLQVEGEGLSE